MLKLTAALDEITISLKKLGAKRFHRRINQRQLIACIQNEPGICVDDVTDNSATIAGGGFACSGQIFCKQDKVRQ